MNLNHKLGTLVMNLLALEFALRETLHFFTSWNTPSPENRDSLKLLKIGDLIDESALSDYRQLGRLINDHNTMIDRFKLSGCKVDEGIVDLRDAIAHGRLFITSLDEAPILLKFSKTKDTKVEVTFFERLTDSWLDQQIEWVFEANNRTVKARSEFYNAQ